jgi:hypothetical protein
MDALAPPTGVISLDSPFYIRRSTDEDLRRAIARRDSIVSVKGPRQMGKTSLMARGLEQARMAGACVVLTDFQLLNAAHLATVEAFYLTLAGWLTRELHLEVTPESVWDALQGPNWNFRQFLLEEVLGRISQPLVWGLDEVDRLFPYDFRSEVFALFRALHNERALNPALPWARLTLAMSHATEAYLFITDLNQSPFNVGTRVTLSAFTTDEIADLNGRYGSPLKTPEEEERFRDLLGGHPYLTHRAIYEMAARGLDLAALAQQADRDDGLFGDHLRRLIVVLAKDAELCEGMRHVLRGQPLPTPDLFYRLSSAGVVGGSSSRDAAPRCQLYATYLKRHLL